jgi:hypothetical protein
MGMSLKVGDLVVGKTPGYVFKVIRVTKTRALITCVNSWQGKDKSTGGDPGHIGWTRWETQSVLILEEEQKRQDRLNHMWDGGWPQLSADEVFARVEKAIARGSKLFSDPRYWAERGILPKSLPTAFNPEDYAQDIRELAVLHLQKLSAQPKRIAFYVHGWSQNWCRTLRRRALEDAREPEFFDEFKDVPTDYPYAVGPSEDSEDKEHLRRELRALKEDFPKVIEAAESQGPTRLSSSEAEALESWRKEHEIGVGLGPALYVQDPPAAPIRREPIRKEPPPRKPSPLPPGPKAGPSRGRCGRCHLRLVTGSYVEGRDCGCHKVPRAAVQAKAG